MLALATTTISVLGGTTTDEFLDEVDGTTLIQSGVIAQLIEIADRVMDPVTNTPKIVRSFQCRVDPRSNITLDNRIRDDADGAIYAIRDITLPKRAGYTADMQMDLQKIN